MKRKFALLTLLILALTIALAACGQTAATDKRARWENETHVFNISLADFNNDTDTFNTYDASGAVVKDGAYYKDILPGEFSTWDEIRPLSVHGSYTINIAPSSDNSECKLTTVQEMCVEYSLTALGDTTELNSVKAKAEQMEKYGITEVPTGSVILWSRTETSVRFENTPTQKPIESGIKVKGFYAGKTAKQVTEYEVATKYDLTGKRPLATITLKNSEGENTVEYQFSKNSAGSFIDSNQLILYARSLDKSANSFQDSPAIYVFNAFDQSLQTASFTLYHEVKMILTNKDEILATPLNALVVYVGNSAFMTQANLPDSLAKQGLDVYFTAGGSSPKFTTTRFRVGYLAYEIDYDNDANRADTTNWDEIWNTLGSAE